ncbi:MAG: hypothetical protein NTW62_03000 [Candidatus Nomurabacteria bacterium]|nr:hypothetical protein [Candidatus Nomurabacteria bacterium]
MISNRKKIFNILLTIIALFVIVPFVIFEFRVHSPVFRSFSEQNFNLLIVSMNAGLLFMFVCAGLGLLYLLNANFSANKYFKIFIILTAFISLLVSLIFIFMSLAGGTTNYGCIILQQCN